MGNDLIIPALMAAARYPSTINQPCGLSGRDSEPSTDDPPPDEAHPEDLAELAVYGDMPAHLADLIDDYINDDYE